MGIGKPPLAAPLDDKSVRIIRSQQALNSAANLRINAGWLNGLSWKTAVGAIHTDSHGDLSDDQPDAGRLKRLMPSSDGECEKTSGSEQIIPMCAA
jgi:hypothetical protein